MFSHFSRLKFLSLENNTRDNSRRRIPCTRSVVQLETGQLRPVNTKCDTSRHFVTNSLFVPKPHATGV